MFPPLGTGEGPPLPGMTAPLGIPLPGRPDFIPVVTAAEEVEELKVVGVA